MFKIIDLDIDRCYEIMHDNTKEKDNLIRWGSIFKAKTINELSNLLGDDLLTAEEKKEFLDNVRAANRNEELVAAWRSERNKNLKREGFENILKKERQKALEEDKEEKTINIIKSMLCENLNYEIISEITGKTIEEIKEIESKM